MAKQRMINTNFWTDSYIQELETDEKYLFLYLLTNQNNNIAGIYEITIKTIEFETGLKKEKIIEILDKFRKDKKIFYFENFIILKNFIKNQALNEKIKIGIRTILKGLPDNISNRLCIDYDRLCIEYDNININSNINSNSNSNINGEIKIVNTNVSQMKYESNTIKESKEKNNKENIKEKSTNELFFENYFQNKTSIIEKLKEKNIEITELDLDEFFIYWSEKNKKGKQRWELEKTFEVYLRILKWISNKKKWEKPQKKEVQWTDLSNL